MQEGQEFDPFADVGPYGELKSLGDLRLISAGDRWIEVPGDVDDAQARTWLRTNVALPVGASGQPVARSGTPSSG